MLKTLPFILIFILSCENETSSNKNTAPTADFTASITYGNLLSQFRFDASTSSDNEDDISKLKFRWDFESDGIWDTEPSATKIINHTFSSIGVKKVKLEVIDSEGLIDSLTKSITISNSEPTASLSGSKINGYLETDFVFDASESSDIETESDDLKIRWDFENDGIWDTQYSSNKVINHRFSSIGVKTVKIDVMDSGGLNSFDSINVNILTSFTSISVGRHHSLALKADNTLWATGYNYSGQLGDGTNINKTVFIKVMDDVKLIKAGRDHSLAIKKDNSLWVTGYNQFGQLGDGTNTNKNTFIKVMDNVKSISEGGHNTFVIKEDNSLWGTGINRSGELGDSTLTDKNIFVKILEGAKEVSSGLDYTLVLKTDGTVWATGSNSKGQFGNNTNHFSSHFIRVNENVISISAGDQHSLVLKTDNTVWASGSNGNGQIGTGEIASAKIYSFTQSSTDVISISSGGFFSLILKSDKSLWAAGSNIIGQFGNGIDGVNANFNNTFSKLTENVRYVSAGEAHTLIIKSDGSLWVSGLNNSGQVGAGNKNNIKTFTEIIF